MTTLASKKSLPSVDVKEPSAQESIVDQINQVGMNRLSAEALEEVRRGGNKTAILDGKLSHSDLLAMKPGIDAEFAAFMNSNLSSIMQLDKLAQEAAKNPGIEGGGASALVAEIQRLAKVFDPSNKASPDMNTLEADMNRALGVMEYFNKLFNAKI